jgi:protein-L-isoaspartate(D-aspartate) O-methyltransferase
MQSRYQDLLEDRLTRCGHSLDAVFRLMADRSTPLVALKRVDANRRPIGDRTIMKILLPLVLSMVAVARESTAQDAECVRERAAMVETIRAYARSDASVLGQQGLSERVLEAMGQTKRHLFIPGRSCAIAYADRPIPIGHGQTISQPFIVALMTQLAEVAPDHVVLEVGTGSGYQAAILAHLVRKVCTIEIIPALAEAAAKTLRDRGYDNVSVRLGDGYGGWPECGPFDAIVVTAAPGQPPPPLIEQLKVGGRLVMPVGPAYTTQQLTVVEKIAPDKTTTRAVGLVRFVPFTRSHN